MQALPPLSPQDLQQVEALWRLMRDLEQKTEGDLCQASDDIEAIKKSLQAFSNHTHPWLQKLSESAKHLSVGMTLRHFSNYLVPVERLLKKNLTDEQFLVTTLDGGPQGVQAKTSLRPLVLVLDHIRSSFNVGSILRTSECFSASKVILTGYTPTPENTKTQKTAMGVDQWISWEAEPSTENAILNLKAQGYRVIALETSMHAESLYSPFQKSSTAFVLGNERFGLDAGVLGLCDEVRKIPLSGIKNSLNVASTAAIALSEWVRQYEQ